jgi:ABC-2 type transport system permease protein
MATDRQEEAQGPRGVRTTFLVARREFVTRARSRVFMVGTALLVIGIPGFIFLQTQVLSRTATLQVGFQGQAQALAASLVAAAPGLGLHVHTRSVADLPSGRSEVQDGSLDALVSGDPGRPP